MKKWLVILIIFIIIFIGTFLYARFIGTKGLKVKEYKIVSSKLNDDFYGLKIVHLSDIHFGSTVNKKDLEKLVEEVNLLKPDIIVLTGDLLTDEWDYNIHDLEVLKGLNATLGKYAVNGNHDLPFDKWENIIEEIDFINLNDNFELIYKDGIYPIVISGISSSYFDISNFENKTLSFNEYLTSLTEDDIKPIYSILLMHEPDFVDNLNLDNYDLVLAGHSHAGQVRFPLIGKVMTPYGSEKYYNEYYKVNNTDLYISSGMGTSKMKIRLFNRPSFNFYRLVNK